MDVLSGRILLHPTDLARSRSFYRDVLGLAVYREFGDPSDPAQVFFLGSGFLEVSGRSESTGQQRLSLWMQVRDVGAEHDRLAAAGVRIVEPPTTQPWGLIECWIEDPTACASCWCRSPRIIHCGETSAASEASPVG